MADIRVDSKSMVKPESVWLKEHARNITTQNGEDGIREKIFEVMGARNRWCVEFGAWDGKHLSTTWPLLNDEGWKGVLIEADKHRFEDLKRNYEGSGNVFLFNKYIEIAEGENSLDATLKQTPIPRDFDFLTIDVDGVDWQIWNSLKDYRPRLVEIEFNPSIPNHVYFVQADNMNISHGSSLLAMIELGKKKGYELVATTIVNAFFVLKEDFPLFNISDNSINSMHCNEGYESILFQLYDGQLALLGCSVLLWKDILINQEDIQVLPVALRKYP